MRIKPNSLVNLIQSGMYREHHLTHLYRMVDEDPQHKHGYISKMKFFTEKNFRKLVFSKKSLDNLTNYVVPKEIRVEVLRILPNRKDIVQLDEYTCIQYIKTDELLSVMFHYTKKNDELTYTFYFGIRLSDGKVTTEYSLYDSGEVMNMEKLIDKFYSKFLVVVTYLELTEVTLNVLQGGRTFGTIKEGKIKNDTKDSFILVNTNWNVTTIRLDEFSVRGHFRLQPCGVGRKQYKYVYIEPYTKGGIKRLAQKKTVGQEEISLA